MRTGLLTAGLLLGLGLPAWGQEARRANVLPWTAGTSFLTGVSPSQRVFQPADLSNVAVPVSQGPEKKFSWADIWPFAKKKPTYKLNPLPTGYPAQTSSSSLPTFPGLSGLLLPGAK